MKTVTVDCRAIMDSESFHDAFVRAFGFPNWYGRNGDAWIDLMTNLDEEGYSDFKVSRDEIVVLSLENASKLKQVAPDILSKIFEMAAFCNWRRANIGLAPILLVSCYA